MTAKTPSQRLRERLEKRARTRELFSDKAPGDVERLEAIQVRLKEAGPNLSPRALQALKLEIETIFRKLAKILPDEKVVEHDIGENVAGSISDDELDTRIAELLRKAGVVRTPATAGPEDSSKPN